LTAEERLLRRRERNRTSGLDAEKLSRKRERDRIRRQRYRQARLMSHDPLALLADTATQAQLLEEIGDDDNDDDGEMLGDIASVEECTRVGTGSFEDEGTLHDNGEGFNLVDIHANSRNPC